MSVIDDASQVLHRIRVKLYPNNLPGRKSELVARTVNEKTLLCEEVNAAAKERGGYTGNLDSLNEHTAIFLREAAHQLCDGFGVNFGGLFTVYPNVGGVFGNERDLVDKTKHKVSFRFRMLHGLRQLADHIEVISEGLADSSGYIAQLEDVATDQVNDVVTKGGIFILSGEKLKVVGDSDKIGVFFCTPDSPTESVKVPGNLAINEPSRIVGTVPELLPDKDWYVEVRTFFSGASANPLKEMRAVRSKFTVKQA